MYEGREEQERLFTLYFTTLLLSCGMFCGQDQNVDGRARRWQAGLAERKGKHIYSFLVD